MKEPFIISEIRYQKTMLQMPFRHLISRVNDYREFRSWMLSMGISCPDYLTQKADELFVELEQMLLN